LLRRGEGKRGKGWDGMGRGGKGRERRGGMGKGLGGSTASWLLGGMDATVSDGLLNLIIYCECSELNN
jgi:hypothetical protein